LSGTIYGAGHDAGDDQTTRPTGRGKDARWKSHKADFPIELGNPAKKNAGFPLFHRPDGCWLNLKPDISLATKTGHFNLLPTGISLAHVFR